MSKSDYNIKYQENCAWCGKKLPIPTWKYCNDEKCRNNYIKHGKKPVQ